MAVVCRVTGLLLFVSASAWGAEWDCESKTYLFCTGGTCSRITETAALAVDTDEGMTLRTTSKGGRDFMRIISVDVRQRHADSWQHGDAPGPAALHWEEACQTEDGRWRGASARRRQQQRASIAVAHHQELFMQGDLCVAVNRDCAEL